MSLSAAVQQEIHDLEGELGIELFKRRREGVALTPAGKSLLVDTRRILEDRLLSGRFSTPDGSCRRREPPDGFISRMRSLKKRDKPPTQPPRCRSTSCG
jgi:DNA-binding transcriptional LysR family regulator